MDNIFIFILASWGLTHLIISGKIMESPRNWLMIRSNFLEDLLNCYQCTGFWSGFLLSFYFTGSFAHMVIMGVISSGVCPLINSAYVYINSRISKIQKED